MQDVVVAWFYLESVAPGLAGALAVQALQGVSYIVYRTTKWFRSGGSPVPSPIGSKIVIGLGAVDSQHRKDIEITLGPEYETEDITRILRECFQGDEESE